VKKGYAPASIALGVPVISGKDSSSGRFTTEAKENIDDPLTLDVLAMGRMPHWCRLIPKAFTKPGNYIVMYAPGLKKIGLGGSLLNDLYGEIGDDLPEVDLRRLLGGLFDYHLMLKRLRWSRGVHSRSVVAEGGLIRRLFEMSLGSGLGCKVNFGYRDKPLELLCGEFNTAIVFTASTLNWRQSLACEDYHILGEVTDEPVIDVWSQGKKLFQCPTEVLAEKWAKTFKEVIS
jgi:phosphoribosylformylglycinamidine synthase